VLAYCSAFKVPVLPFGSVNLTKDLVVANVSSKSNIVIPFEKLARLTLLDCITALPKVLGPNEKEAKAESLIAFLNLCTSLSPLIINPDVLAIFLVLS